MSGCSDFFHSLQALEIDRRNQEKYDTTDLEEIERIKKHKDKCFEEEVDKKLQNKLQNTLPAIQEQERINARKLIREEYQLAEGTKIYGLCRFISEKVTVNGEELYPNMFIPDKPVNDLISDDVLLNFDDTTERWLVRVKNGLPKLISRFVVTACLIVDASGPGACRAFVIFLKGEAKPLIFWDGTIEAAELRRQTQFHQKGLSYAHKDLYHESFLRALSMCSSVYFLTLPKHGGWNMTPDGLRVFVDSGMMQPQFEGLFLKNDAKDKKRECNKNKLHNCFLDISLLKTEREYKDVKADYHILLPNTLPIKVGTVMSAMSRFLPFFKEEGLEQDRLWVVETSDNVTAKVMTAVMHNRDYHSIEALFSSKRISNIEEKVKEYIDCVMIIRHSTAIGSKYKLENIQEFLDEFFKNTYVDGSVNRMVPVLLIDNAGVLSEDLAMHQLSLIERLSIDNYEQAQQILGELHFHIVKFAERNPDEMKQRLKTAITTAKEMINTLPRRSRSSSAIMFIATTLLLKKDEILTDDVNAMLRWLCTEARERTSMSRSVCKAVGATFSSAICSGRLPIAKQYGPPFWTADSAFVALDDSINVTKDTMNDDIFTDIPVGWNTALQHLQDEDVLFKDKESKGGQKTWTVETEDGVKKPRRFYSFSRDLLTPKANRIVDEKVASDLFQKLEKPIDNFFPFIKHPRFDMYAGQVITDYKHGTPFIDVTGSVGSGKTTWLMMQALQRAEADDLIVVMDPTNSFCREELITHGIPAEKIDRLFSFWDMSTQGWPVNILDFEGCMDITQRNQRLSSLLISGMHLTGTKQKAIVTAKSEEWLRKFEINNKLSIFSLPASFDENAYERDLKMRLEALLSTVKKKNNEVQPLGWNGQRWEHCGRDQRACRPGRR